MAFEEPVPEAEAVPFVAAVAILQVRMSPGSGSAACSVSAKATGVPSSVHIFYGYIDCDLVTTTVSIFDLDDKTV